MDAEKRNKIIKLSLLLAGMLFIQGYLVYEIITKSR